jgi:hypothetical protein
MNDPSIERHIAGPNVIEGDAVEGSFRHFYDQCGLGQVGAVNDSI